MVAKFMRYSGETDELDFDLNAVLFRFISSPITAELLFGDTVADLDTEPFRCKGTDNEITIKAVSAQS